VPIASVLVCQGCCCGHPENGNAEIPRARLEAAWAERKLEAAVRLRFVDCLGPCQPANLACLKTRRTTVWLAGLADVGSYDELTAWAEQSRDLGKPAPLPASLQHREIPPPQDG
jgi:cobaltochelatase CobN